MRQYAGFDHFSGDRERATQSVAAEPLQVHNDPFATKPAGISWMILTYLGHVDIALLF